MAPRGRVLASLLTTKLIVGITGLLLFLYLILHIAGNLMVFLGQDVFNRYSYALISNPLVAPVEIGLLIVFLIHRFTPLVRKAGKTFAVLIAGGFIAIALWMFLNGAGA